MAVVTLTDLLAQFDELHLCWHVSHGPHTLPQVFMADVAFFVPVELHKGLTELWQKHTENTFEFLQTHLSWLSCWLM